MNIQWSQPQCHVQLIQAKSVAMRSLIHKSNGDSNLFNQLTGIMKSGNITELLYCFKDLVLSENSDCSFRPSVVEVLILLSTYNSLYHYLFPSLFLSYTIHEIQFSIGIPYGIMPVR